MSKRHFIALADALRATKPADPCGSEDARTFMELTDWRTQWNRDVKALAAFCAAQNPRFDRARWLGYIAGENGPSGGTGKVIG